MTNSLSKLCSPAFSSASTVLSAALWVAINSTRKRRREGGGDVPLLGAGGRGGTRPNRKKAQARYSNRTGKERWMLRCDKTQMHWDFIENVDLVRDPSSKLARLFRAKMRISYPMFEKILQDTRESRLFADDQGPRKAGQQPHPLALKVMAALRRLALGIPVSGLEDIVGISAPVLDKFIPQWEDYI